MCTKPPDYRFRVALHDTDAAGILSLHTCFVCP